MLAYYNRRLKVLAAFLLVGGFLFAVPASAVDDAPFTPSYLPGFDACEDVPPSDFTDLPSHHAHIDNINCIAHFGITKGTSATTYSPDNAVTREQMALFLIRLAQRVEIAIPSSRDFGFVDIGHLRPGSRAAINQLARLGITRGTTLTTYSPANVVTRGQMALFISRLMNKMDPVTHGGYTFGYTPADVIQSAERQVAAPFTDLEEVSKETFDAVTNLYEMGVVTGISDTAYEPRTAITRATMADFMAAVLDHSNLRPAGLSIKAARISDFGATQVVVMASLRDPGFGPVLGQWIDVFGSQAESGGLGESGVCVAELVTGDCTWGIGDSVTDQKGNVWAVYSLGEGATGIYYAWIGSQMGELFDADDVDEATASVTSQWGEFLMEVSSDIREHADDNTVHLAQRNRVTLSVQLKDRNDMVVARQGIEIKVGLAQQSNGTDGFSSDEYAVLTTDGNGKATLTIDGVDDDRNDPDQNRIDRVTFQYCSGELTQRDLPDASVTIRWVEEAPQTHKVVTRAPDYVLVDADAEVRIRASVTFYDQYGLAHRTAAGQTVGIGIGNQEVTVPVSGFGMASRNVVLDGQSRGSPLTVSVTADPAGDGVDLDTNVDVPDDVVVQVVTEADEDDEGEKQVHTFFAGANRFTTEAERGGSEAILLYSYDEDDIFSAGGRAIGIEEFEELLTSFEGQENEGVVDVVKYDPNGIKHLKVVADADGVSP